MSTFIASLFNLGYSSKAPGTLGSAATMPLIIFVTYFFGFIGLFIVTILLLIIALYVVDGALLNTENKDPHYIVIDEAVGQCITFLAVASALSSNFTFKTIVAYIAGFILFRLFDIWKPYPVSYFDEQVEGSKGVVYETVAAGIYAALFLNIFYLLIP